MLNTYRGRQYITLKELAVEPGYSYGHIRALVARGVIPTLGAAGAPLVRCRGHRISPVRQGWYGDKIA